MNGLCLEKYPNQNKCGSSVPLATPTGKCGSMPREKAETLVRSVKLCESGGESPPGLAAEPPEFRMKMMNGKV